MHDAEPASHWHALQAEEALELLTSTRNGLRQEEASQRLSSLGANLLPEATRRSAFRRFLSQFHNTLIYFLLAAASAAAVLDHMIDTAVILAVVIVNAVTGYIQEGKAERALDAIQDMIAPQASVIRDGQRVTIAVHDIVPGDLVLVEAGDRVPADLRLLRARRLLVDEALLTGESATAEKAEEVVPADAALGDRRNMAFSGTLVAAGQATGLAVATGASTEIGRISTMIQSVERLTTPLLYQIEQFARRFTLFVLIGGAVLFAFAVLARGYDWVEALIAVVALAVGIVPEGLPAVITVTLAIGVRRMAQRNAVIRKLPAVETLGATSVICTDKTGTLTLNEMTARRVVTASHEMTATGSGYAPEGMLEATCGGDETEALAAAMPLLRCALLCNEAALREQRGHWLVDGDPMEGALLALGIKAGIEPNRERREWLRIDEIPFDAEHRFMATLHHGPTGEAVAFIKGAPKSFSASPIPPIPRTGTTPSPEPRMRASACWRSG